MNDARKCVCAAFTDDECEELVGCQWRMARDNVVRQAGICRSDQWVDIYDGEDGPTNLYVKSRVSSLDWPWSVLCPIGAHAATHVGSARAGATQGLRVWRVCLEAD